MRNLLGFGVQGWLGPLLAASIGAAAPAVAQSDSVTVVAGERYAASGLEEALLGRDHRALWTTPVRVEVLDLQRVGGGLRPLRRGGGEQTRSLRLRGADGREYSFRSVNKYPSLTDEPALDGTLVGRLIQDQVSSLHPAAGLVAAPLLDAAGVLNITPRLFVMPDDPALGEFRAEFAGMLGTLEERPDEDGPDDAPLGRFPRIIGTERLLERLEESPEDRVDSRAYLRARLMDVWLGDWDRHQDQWRWAEDRRGDVSFWVAIPRDRDYVFSDYDGLLLSLARALSPNAVRFGPRLRNVRGLTLNAQELDRRLLQDLPRAAWDSVALDLQARLGDAVIEAAVRRMPPEYQRISAAELARDLRARRDQLPSAAASFYASLASEVDVHGTDERDSLVADRIGEEQVEVRLYATGSGEPYFRRRFSASETTEVRVYLQGGDDQALVRGDVGESLMVRVIGGGGDDVLVDSSTVRGDRRETAFYDDRGDNRFVRGRQTVVDRRTYRPPPITRDISGQGFRDWGRSSSFEPFLDYRGTEGLVLGGGPKLTRFGFRKTPYAFRLAARGMVGLGSGGLGADVRGDFRRTASSSGASFFVSASQLESIRFFGYGNESRLQASSGRYTIPQDQIVGTATLNLALGGALFSVGPMLKYTNPDVPDDHPVGVLPPYGSGGFGQLGGVAEIKLDTRDRPAFPLRGVRLTAGASGYPVLWNVPNAFGEAHASAASYLPVPLGREAALALRVGGQKVWGVFPVHEAAFLGGSRTVRGYPYQRFAGDAMVFANAELRAPLAPAVLLLRGELGVLALADVGRVYMDGESPGGWHTALGAGLWMRFRIREGVNAVSATYARGAEGGRVYLKLGMPF